MTQYVHEFVAVGHSQRMTISACICTPCVMLPSFWPLAMTDMLMSFRASNNAAKSQTMALLWLNGSGCMATWEVVGVSEMSGSGGREEGDWSLSPAMQSTSSLCPTSVLRQTRASMSHTRTTLSLPPLSRRPPMEQSVSTLPLCPLKTLHWQTCLGVEQVFAGQLDTAGNRQQAAKCDEGKYHIVKSLEHLYRTWCQDMNHVLKSAGSD